MFTVGESRPILLMQIMNNAVKRLRDGLALRHLSALYMYILQMWWIELKYGFYLQNPTYFPRISLWILDKYSSTSFWQRLYQQTFTAKKVKIFDFVLSVFLNRIVFTYWLVSICLYCCPFTPSRCVAINVFLVVTMIRLANKNDVTVQIGYFTVFLKEHIHGNKYVN